MTLNDFLLGLYLILLGVLYWRFADAPDCAHGWSNQTGGHKDDCPACLEESLQ